MFLAHPEANHPLVLALDLRPSFSLAVLDTHRRAMRNRGTEELHIFQFPKDIMHECYIICFFTRIFYTKFDVKSMQCLSVYGIPTAS